MTKRIKIKDRFIGGGAEITIQSMTNTRTEDVGATVAQIKRLERAGCDIVRMSVNNEQAAAAIPQIKAAVKVPLVADIHFDYKLALVSIRNGIDKIRINPSNIGSESAVREVVTAAKDAGIPIRVGVNGGSLEKDSLQKYGYSAEALADSALKNLLLLEKFGFENVVISAKCSEVKMNAEAYRILAKKTDYPLHIGVTEAGGGDLALAKSYAGIGFLLLDGIGDTIRVSLTGDPVEEVYAADLLLKAIGIRKNFVEVVSCPTCARTEIPVFEIAEEIKRVTRDVKKRLTVAVMGCVVNGIGEGSHADIGVAGGKEKSVIMKHGKILKTVPNETIAEELLKEINSGEYD